MPLRLVFVVSAFILGIYAVLQRLLMTHSTTIVLLYGLKPFSVVVLCILIVKQRSTAYISCRI